MARLFAAVWLTALLLTIAVLAVTLGGMTVVDPDDLRPGTGICERFDYLSDCRL